VCLIVTDSLNFACSAYSNGKLNADILHHSSLIVHPCHLLRAVVWYLLVFARTGDHSTPVLYGDHSCEPVPFVICPNAHQLTQDDPYSDADSRSLPSSLLHALKHDQVMAFDEISARDGILGRFKGQYVMEIIKNVRQEMLRK
jgi:hypothetical protein